MRRIEGAKRSSEKKIGKVDAIVPEESVSQKAFECGHSIHQLRVEVIDLPLAIRKILGFFQLQSFAVVASLLRLCHAMLSFELPNLRELHPDGTLSFSLSRCRRTYRRSHEPFESAPSSHGLIPCPVCSSINVTGWQRNWGN
ncbi:hypothetical protein J2W39_006078 [Variovorax paradoxus]|uniref:Uncharacterized protein n=1 Tax=Variovorax paradoxus TaxID=34073 RepID=A0AAW8ERG5_VARPD|nr:hypothetical protein [Variovorax paradoxus]